MLSGAASTPPGRGTHMSFTPKLRPARGRGAAGGAGDAAGARLMSYNTLPCVPGAVANRAAGEREAGRRRKRRAPATATAPTSAAMRRPTGGPDGGAGLTAGWVGAAAAWACLGWVARAVRPEFVRKAEEISRVCACSHTIHSSPAQQRGVQEHMCHVGAPPRPVPGAARRQRWQGGEGGTHCCCVSPPAPCSWPSCGGTAASGPTASTPAVASVIGERKGTLPVPRSGIAKSYCSFQLKAESRRSFPGKRVRELATKRLSDLGR